MSTPTPNDLVWFMNSSRNSPWGNSIAADAEKEGVTYEALFASRLQIITDCISQGGVDATGQPLFAIACECVPSIAGSTTPRETLDETSAHMVGALVGAFDLKPKYHAAPEDPMVLVESGMPDDLAYLQPEEVVPGFAGGAYFLDEEQYALNGFGVDNSAETPIITDLRAMLEASFVYKEEEEQKAKAAFLDACGGISPYVMWQGLKAESCHESCLWLRTVAKACPEEFKRQIGYVDPNFPC